MVARDIRRNANGEPWNEERYDAGEYKATQKHRQWTNEVFKRVQADLHALPNNGSSSANMEAYINHKLKFFNELCGLLLQTRFAKLEFQRYISRQRTIERVAKVLTGGKEHKEKRARVTKDEEKNDIKKKKKQIIFMGSPHTRTSRAMSVHPSTKLLKPCLRRCTSSWCGSSGRQCCAPNAISLLSLRGHLTAGNIAKNVQRFGTET